MSTRRQGPAWYRQMHPLEQMATRVFLKIVLPAFALAIINPALSAAYVLGWFFYGAFLVARWAVLLDRKEKEQNTVEKSLWAEMRDVADKIEAEEDAKKAKPKKKLRRPKRMGRDGNPMPCIMCDEDANGGGLYCDTHDV